MSRLQARLLATRAAGGAPIPRRRERAVVHPMVRLQRAAGNRAVAAVIQRDRGSRQAAVRDAGPTLAAFNASHPGIIAAMSFEQLKVWHDVITGWAENRKVDEALLRHEKRERATWLDPSSNSPIVASDYLRAHERIKSRRKFVDEGKSRARLDPAAILAPEISAAQPWNVDAEARYRTWAVQQFSSKPLVAELTSRPEYVSALEEMQNPGLGSGIPHANLLWDGFRIKHTKGIVTWNDLMDLRSFRDRYAAEVSNSPAMQALRAGIGEIESHIGSMKIEHEARSDANAEHGVVRHISEALGGPSTLKLAILRAKVRANPSDLDAKAALAAKEAEAGDYPRLRTTGKGRGIWQDAEDQLAAARRLLAEGKFELAVAALTESEHSTTLATARFAGYERRVMGGAGIAVKWLERAKTGGKIASAFTGTGGVVRAAVGAAGYSFAQEGSQQVVAHWIDPSNKIDLKGLTQQAAIEGLASLFGGITQGAFVSALTARFGARLVSSGMSEATARTVLSAAGATTSAFYNVPAKIVLDRIIAGKEAPDSLAAVSDMIVAEAVQSGAMDVVGSYVSSTRGKAPPEQAPPRPGEITAPHGVAESLAGPEAAALLGPRPAPSAGGPVRGPVPPTIISEARQIAGHLEPLRHDWPNLSPAMRAQRLIDGVHQTLAATGVPKPVAILKKTGGGLFHQDTWIAEIDASLLRRKHLNIDQFAAACEIARHEMEHALQFFRMARREATRTRQDPQTLSTRLHMPLDKVQAAIEANAGRRPAEKMPAGGALDQATARQYENVYEKGENRNRVLTALDGAFAAIDTASARLMAEKDPVLVHKALDDLLAAEATHRPVIEEYRNFPEEVPAFEAGEHVYHAVRQQARLADAVRRTRLDERRAYAAASKAWEDARRDLATPGVRLPSLVRAALNRAVRRWVASLDRARRAEHKLIRVLEGRGGR